MRRAFPPLCGAIIASVGLLQPVAAADFPQGYAPQAPLPGFYNWTGFYVGGQGGYGHGAVDVTPLAANIDGWFAGGQLGWNFQNPRSPWVVGIEIDSAFGKIERDVDFIYGNPATGAFSQVNYFGSARARLGYAIDRALIYGTGGVAWAHNEVGLYADPNRFSTLATAANTHVGFVAGAGLEWALARNWTMKFEYLYNFLGSENYQIGGVPGGINAGLNIGTGRVGLNYVFDWGRGYVGPKF